MDIVLTAISDDLAEAWADATRDLDFVEVRRGSIFETGADALVSQAEIVETGGVPRYLISAPTMRVPMILGRETVVPYLAARAVLLLVRHGCFDDGTPIADVVTRVAFPGLGTGIGQVPAKTCARQVRAAIDEVLGAASFPTSWHDAQTRHQLLYADDVRDLQYLAD